MATTIRDDINPNRNNAASYYFLEGKYPGCFSLETPYPPAELSEDQLEELKFQLNRYMPIYSMIIDLWDWDIHFENMLGDEWYFESVFGSASTLKECAEELADYFIEQDYENNLGYDQDDQGDFKVLIAAEAEKFIAEWRHNFFIDIGENLYNPPCQKKTPEGPNIRNT